jgi:hypothetical protein
MILVHAAKGLVIELAPGPSGRFDRLSVRVGEGDAATAVVLEVAESPGGRLLVRAAEPRGVDELSAVLTALAANEGRVLPELRKYNWHR